MSALAAVSWIARDEAAGDTVPAALFDLHWEPPVATTRRRELSNWKQYVAVASQVVGRFQGQFRLAHFDYMHPTRLQPETVRRLKRPYKVNVAYADWGPRDAPVVICLGGVASVAMRFNYLASDLCDEFRLICMDWVGRGRSGWLADLGSPAWSRAASLGLAVGLPAALAYGLWAATHASLEENVLLPAWVLVLQFFGPALSVSYAVVFLRRAPDVVVAWLAPAGRMPLTNYLLQSVAMGALLSGWGLALGINASYAELTALALGVFVLQLVGSRWWLARHAQGPLEAVWRAWTYHGLGRGTAL